MKKRDIYEIAIKLLGIYVAFITLNQCKDFLALLFFIPAYKNVFDNDWTILFSGFVLIGTLLITYLLLFKTQKIVKLIAQPSDEEIVNVQFSKKQLYQICLVLSGILTIVFSISEFIHVARNFSLSLKDAGLQFNKIHWVFPIVKVIVGVLLVKFSVALSDYINDKIK
ncbi:hypothetical protein [Capnocytophaga canimorsus]|uniref:hypothetical protein n=1 Tax=Capnocytophaga canimorsus TaxID=28188 RepID=UPI0028E5087B|nr:hypothetical protein [Capnocytophaga canimorsus]MDT9498540.1 hypothetical protein [Capnocytophaga canimorsus]